MKAATTISGHLKDLGKRDIETVLEVRKWLESTVNDARDISHRTQSKRLCFRLIAAQMLLKAAHGDVTAAKEVMDRTEGKVKDTLEITEFRSLSLTIDLSARNQTALEAVNQTLLGAGEPQPIVVPSEPADPATRQQAEPQSIEPDPKD